MVPRRFTFNVYQVGTAVALVSITSFFVALILVYLFTFRQMEAESHIHVPWTLWASTLVLAISSAALERARFALRRGMVSGYKSGLTVTMAIGVVFLVLQMFSLKELMDEGVYMKTNPHGSVFYVFTSIHGAHLIGGLAWLWYLIRRLHRVRPDVEHDLRHQRYATGAASLYWHFIGVLWLILFVLLLAWS